jgi:hypothetical protein
MTTKMLADRLFSYRGVGLKLGEEFDCDDEHVALFEKIGHAHRVAHANQSYMTRAMTAGRRRAKREGDDKAKSA